LVQYKKVDTNNIPQFLPRDATQSAVMPQ